jgi:hypothetical protein
LNCEVSRINNILNIGINIYEISKAELTGIMDELGFKPLPTDEKKGVVASWLDKLERPIMRTLLVSD